MIFKIFWSSFHTPPTTCLYMPLYCFCTCGLHIDNCIEIHPVHTWDSFECAIIQHRMQWRKSDMPLHATRIWVCLRSRFGIDFKITHRSITIIFPLDRSITIFGRGNSIDNDIQPLTIDRLSKIIDYL